MSEDPNRLKILLFSMQKRKKKIVFTSKFSTSLLSYGICEAVIQAPIIRGRKPVQMNKIVPWV